MRLNRTGVTSSFPLPTFSRIISHCFQPHKFETGKAYNVSLGTFLLLMKAIGCIDQLDELLPDLPPSAYLVNKGKKVQRIRHKTQPQKQ